MSTKPLTIHSARKLWQLLQVAIDDAKEIQKDPRYTLDMSIWHSKHGYQTTCHVCMAGAVMALELGVVPTLNHNPADFDLSIEYKLEVINALRTGSLHNAWLYHTMGNGSSPAFPWLVHMASNRAHQYSDEPWTDDWEAHLALVEALKEADL